MFSYRRRRKPSAAFLPRSGLESRVVPSAVTVSVTGGVVRITGTPDADSVRITKLDAGGFTVSTDAASTFSLSGAPAAASVTIPAARLVTLDVDLGAGGDTFVADKLDASVVRINDAAAASETSTISFLGGQLGTITAKVVGGKAIFLIDAASATKIFGDVSLTLQNTTEGDVQYTAAQDLLQTGKLSITSKEAASSVDHVTLSGKISLGGLSALLGGQDDSVQILNATHIVGATQVEIGSGNDVVNIDGLAGTVKLDSTVNVLLGDGNDTLVVHGTSSGVQALGKVTVDAGNGHDIVSLTGARFQSSLGVSLGTGRNSLIMDHLSVNDITKVTTAKSGLGDIVETGASVFAKSVTMQLGAGSVIVDGFGKKFWEIFKDTLRITGLEKRPSIHLIFSAPPPSDKLFVVKADKTITIAPAPPPV
jgi:hypothetical protein